MLKGKMVRIRFRKEYPEQPSWVFFGKVLQFSENWIGVDGKGLLIFKRQAVTPVTTSVKNLKIIKEEAIVSQAPPVELDAESRYLLLRAEHITNIRMLPDDFNLDSLQIKVSGRRISVVVHGGPDTSIDEIMED